MLKEDEHRANAGAFVGEHTTPCETPVGNASVIWPRSLPGRLYMPRPKRSIAPF